MAPGLEESCDTALLWEFRMIVWTKTVKDAGSQKMAEATLLIQ
jgi:hypothetical protein